MKATPVKGASHSVFLMKTSSVVGPPGASARSSTNSAASLGALDDDLPLHSGPG